MNLPAALFAIRCLVHDTFRQSLASRIFWLMLIVSGLCIVLCLSVHVEGVQSLRRPGETELITADDQPYTGADPKHGQMTLAFGAVRLGLFRDAESQVHFIQSILAKWVAGAAGTLLALIWTAGFLPEFLQPSAASVLLAKPVPRWSLLVGKFIGVMAFVGFQALVFVGGTWAALGLRTGVWLPGYLLAAPLLLLNFAVIYSFSALLAVYTRSTVACVFGSILFWLLCCGMNYGRHAVLAQETVAPEMGAYPDQFLGMVEAGYWFLPKPADMGILLQQALDTGKHFSTLPEFQTVMSQGAFHPELSLLTSLVFCVGMLAIAARQLATTDY
jgi:ABC-type transport system involved in multi-copper enzyme maturation permease subunit